MRRLPRRLSRPKPAQPRRRRIRERHGRAMRGPLVPTSVPLYRTPTEQFDDLVLDAVEHVERRWRRELSSVEFAVEDVPPAESTDAAGRDEDILADGAVPLARLLRAQPGGDGGGGRSRIVIYRRPLESRAMDRHELSHLVHDVVVEQVAHLFGIGPDEVDSPSPDEP